VATIRERSPEVHLFLEIAPDRVDVNVHPTKAEVRFLESSLVHEVVRRGLGEALGRGRAPELQFRVEAPGTPEPIAQAIPGVVGTAAGDRSRWAPLHAVFGRSGESAAVPPGAVAVESEGERGMAGAVARPMMPLGQFRDTFIIAVDEDGIAIVDQHVAHERILFEQVMERLSHGRLESQRLLEPLLLSLSETERQALGTHTEALDRLGFEVDAFGGNSLRVTAIPGLLDRQGCEAAIRVLANDLEGLDRGARVEEALRQIAATTACHAAVKANDRLTHEKMVYILDELRRTAYSSVCPHGRPVVLRLTRREIEKSFQRI
jgi:DNA mismatch repair protein MutL